MLGKIPYIIKPVYGSFVTKTLTYISFTLQILNISGLVVFNRISKGINLFNTLINFRKIYD